MAKILLIEPQRILQQAIALALFPEHDVQAESGTAAAGAATWKDYELVIADGAALREVGQLTAELLETVRSATTPMVWLEEDAREQAPLRANLFLVRKPIDREAFRSAVAEALSPSKTSQREGQSAAGAGESTKKSTASALQESFKFIDLVDVVAEEGKEQRKKTSGKTK